MVNVATGPGYRRRRHFHGAPLMPSHYFDPVPSAAPSPRFVELALDDLTLSLATDSGVFSGGRVDPGTKLLLQEAPRPPATGNLLDLGCGYGPITVALARRAPAASVWGVDVNSRALELTRRNAVSGGATNVVATSPGAMPEDLRFAAAYSNPPIRIGKQMLRSLLATWLPRSEVSYLVVHKNLGSDSLAAWMSEERRWAVKRLVSRLGYRILEVRP
ncbi:MAG: methyltransferase [Acidimicrobiales bacterium]